jgi:hypothetical protein
MLPLPLMPRARLLLTMPQMPMSKSMSMMMVPTTRMIAMSTKHLGDIIWNLGHGTHEISYHAVEDFRAGGDRTLWGAACVVFF